MKKVKLAPTPTDDSTPPTGEPRGDHTRHFFDVGAAQAKLAKEEAEQAAANEALQARRGKLSYEEVSVVLKLDAAGKTQTEIAEFMKVDQSSISRILSQFKDTRPLAKQRLHGAAEMLAERVLHASEIAAKRGDASPALEVLDRIEAVPKRVESGSGTAKVVVIVGNTPPPDFGALQPAIPAVRVIEGE